jgi:hypothetical protein
MINITNNEKTHNPQNSPCSECGSTDYKIGFMYDSLNRIRYPYYCTACGHRTTRYIKISEVKQLGYETIEAIGDKKKQRYK